MANAYHVETIERITEQMIEEEILNEIEDIESDATGKIESVRDETLEFIEGQKDEMSSFFENAEAKLSEVDSDVESIRRQIIDIAPSKESEIEDNIRVLILENGYELKYHNDGHGNATIAVEEVNGDGE